jgi:anti-sigma regulatory factor (Ser/Thr protein kinase)
VTARAVKLRFPPKAGHVRTARLVAAAAARRAGLDEVRLDELRVAVGEACTRALHRCVATGVTDPVELAIDDTDHGLTIEVTDRAGPGSSALAEDPVVVALLQGLADAVEVLDGPCSAAGLIRLEWWR